MATMMPQERQTGERIWTFIVLSDTLEHSLLVSMLVFIFVRAAASIADARYL